MSALPYHKRYHSDALAGMMPLTLEERGAYNTLLDMIYDRGGPLIDKHRQSFGVEPLCGVLQVSPSAYRRHAARLRDRSRRSARAIRDEELAVQIHRVWQENYEV